MKFWIARDPDGTLYLYTKKPKYHSVSEMFISTNGVWINLSNYGIGDFPEVTFENSPMEVELVIKK